MQNGKLSLFPNIIRFCDSHKDCNFQASGDSGKDRKINTNILEGISTLWELNIIRPMLSEPTRSLFTQPAKRTSEFSNRTCVFIRSMCLTLSLNKKFEATFTQDIHHIASVYSQIKEFITENIGNNTCWFAIEDL